MAKHLRRIVQVFSTIAANGYFKGFVTGTIYKGKLKGVCVPGLNCYSCPGALGACPIGSIQSVIGSVKYNFSLYILGFLSTIGVLFGRLICGWLCPFGFIQELLHKLPIPKLRVSEKANNILKYFKYAILFVFVLGLPLAGALSSDLGTSDPYFCKLICPAGTLEGGIPLVLMNSDLKGALGFLYIWKLSLLAVIIFFAITVYRSFCRYICPLGAFYSFFNPISFYSMKVDHGKCTSCNVCTRSCKMGIKVYESPNSGECIRCGECIKVCPSKALSRGFRGSEHAIPCPKEVNIKS